MLRCQMAEISASEEAMDMAATHSEEIRMDVILTGAIVVHMASEGTAVDGAMEDVEEGGGTVEAAGMVDPKNQPAWLSTWMILCPLRLPWPSKSLLASEISVR
jgi:hypothetical protein